MELSKKTERDSRIFLWFLEKQSTKHSSINNRASKINVNHIFNFYHFPKELRRIVYSNNLIKLFNKEIRRNAKAHVQFCTEDAEGKFLVTLFDRFNFNTLSFN